MLSAVMPGAILLNVMVPFATALNSAFVENFLKRLKSVFVCQVLYFQKQKGFKSYFRETSNNLTNRNFYTESCFKRIES